MQATTRPDQQASAEVKYADGFGEYANYYGGTTYKHFKPVQAVNTIIQELEAPEQTLHDATNKRESTTSSHTPAMSYDLAANALEFKKDAEGLQLAFETQQAPVSPPLDHPGMIDPHYNLPHQGLAPAPPHSDMPTPLGYGYRHAGMNPHVYQFPQAPVYPKQQPIHMYPPQSQYGYAPQYMYSPFPQDSRRGFQQQQQQQPPPHGPLPPQPLKFQRTTTLPISPPPSIGQGSAATDDDVRNAMQSLQLSNNRLSNISGQALNESPKLPPGALSRMNTISSISSGHSSTCLSSPAQTPASPFLQQRLSTAISTTGGNPVEVPELSPVEAKAEIMSRLSKVSNSTKRGSTEKKGFSLMRSKTSVKPTTGPSQDALTDVLEEVAQEGNVALVKAVLSLGADPIYRSAGKLKKVKHEALAKATAGGHAGVVDLLLQSGASYGEPQKKGGMTPVDRALLTAVYKGHVELSACLIKSHGANPMTEQWPREVEDTQHYWADKQVRISKHSVLDGISKWKNIDQGMDVLRIILQNPNFDPTALVSGLFDTKSEVQSAEFNHRPWQTTYLYSALACFVRAGWADVVEDMLSLKPSIKDYEKEDEVLQYQDKFTRHISPINALTNDTWASRPEDSLRILKLLIDRGFDPGFAQRTASDMGPRTALGRALSANAAQGIELILQSKPSLVREEISFRRAKKEIKALPLAVALVLDKLDVSRVLLRFGAHPRDPALDNMNSLHFAAHEASETSAALLPDMLNLAPELTYDALSIAIRKLNKAAVRTLLDSISAAAMRGQIAALPPVYDSLLLCSNTEADVGTAARYLDLIGMVFSWDAGRALDPPQLPAILAAIRKDNFVGMEKLMQLSVVDGRSLVLNSKAIPTGEEGEWSLLECAEGTKRSSEWLGLLRSFGAPLFQ